ncbi:MAG: hypothetical protein JWQ11_3675 [Rhizobacter sp.]|nr:hypothetical protein [Rhizobacter sp.]
MEMRRSPLVRATNLLVSALESEGLDAGVLCDAFSCWKSRGPAGEFSDFYFGKDSEYVRPKRNGVNVLRHAHLPPVSDVEALTEWNVRARRSSREVSDTCLIYAHDQRHGFLLIYIAREPYGHTLAQMETSEARQLMNDFCDVAEAFVHEGRILI